MADSAHTARVPLFRTRWLRIWLLMVGLATAMMLTGQVFGNEAVSPAVLFYLSAAGPIALLVATRARTGIGANLPQGTLFGIFVFGGGVALTVAVALGRVFIGDAQGPSALFVGPIEELAKLIPPVALALTGRCLSKASGVVLGLATATGFAVLQGLHYAYDEMGEGIASSAGTLVVLGLVLPFTQVVLTGLSCAIVFEVWERCGRVVITPAVLGGFLTAVALHFLFDGSAVLAGLVHPVFLLGLPIVAAATYWLFHRATRDLET